MGAIAAVNVWFGSTHAVAGAAALGTVFWLPGEYDSLIWLAVAAGVLTAAAAVITTEVLTPFLTVYGVITGFVAGWFGTGVVAGSVRAFSRSFNSSNENA